ncbi:MAG: O-antigen ligase family protein [Chlamydiales bacterium]|nr:O-antigen ligase family protein [Chlamydiales bacterium]
MTFAFLPFLFYCILSAFFTHQRPFYEDAYPLFRSFLLLAQTLFMLGAAYCYTGEKERLIKLYLGGYFLSLLVGYLFFLGYYTQFLSIELIQRFSIETQTEWGLLRFSPGTYPNEYGNISSFALSTLLIFFARKRRFLTLMLIIFTFVAFLLTTTRAAYLSFLVCLMYLSFQSREIRKLMTFFSLIGLLILLLLKLYSIDFLQIFIGGIKAINFYEGSVGMRVAAWVKGFLDLNEHLILGNGFGSDIYAHNIYLELLFELGLIGVMVLVVTFIYSLSSYSFSLKFFWKERKSLMGMITVVGLIHVFMFALTNHNLHHHLTFFSFLLFNLYLFGYRRDEAKVSYLRRTEA